MTIYYLYVKTHRITGLKYLGKTKQDPYKYRGSGVYWTSHIKKHGYLVDADRHLRHRGRRAQDRRAGAGAGAARRAHRIGAARQRRPSHACAQAMIRPDRKSVV